MRCDLRVLGVDSNVYEIRLDCELPELFERDSIGLLGLSAKERRRTISGRRVLRSTPLGRERMALRLARTNRGKLPYEDTWLPASYSLLLDQLVRIKGLVSIFDGDQLRLLFETNSYHDPAEIARQIAEALRASFYPDQELVFGPGLEQKNKSRKSPKSR